MVTRSSGHLQLLPETFDGRSAATVIDSYRRLADVFHGVLAEQSLDAVLVRVADTLSDLIPHDTLTIYEAEEGRRVLVPVLARDDYAEEILRTRVRFSEGITGWAACNRRAALVNQAHLDPRVRFVPGTPIDPEALIAIPLIARSCIKGVLNIYRVGEDAAFSEDEFELAQRFGDAAALALDNAQIRARLEHQARTDSLTGLLNHRSFHEELLRALEESSRTNRPVAVLMLDIDDFKRVNDVHGHGVGDELLALLADTLQACVRPEDVVCRLGGEEFAVIMSGCDGVDARRVAERVLLRLAAVDLPAVGGVTVSVGLAYGPDHAMNSRELAACAEAAMMTAKAQGKNRIVLYHEESTQRPGVPAAPRDLRSITHLKMLQTLSGKLTRLNGVREIGEEIAAELRPLIDYHNCRVFVVDGTDDLVPIAFRGDLATEPAAVPLELLRTRIGKGVTGRCAERGESLLVPDAANCEFGTRIAGTPVIEESLLAVPLLYGSRVVGVIVVSKLGLDQFDDADVRLLEVLAGHAAVAIENARLYESARREAQSATALLEFGRDLAAASGLDEMVERVVELSAEILGFPRTSVWIESDGWLVPRAFHGYTASERAHVEGVCAEAGLIVPEREPYVVTAEEVARFLPEPPCPGAPYAIAPFEVDGRACCIAVVIGAESFGEPELRLLAGLAQQAKLALANASSYEGLERTFVSTVEALAKGLRANDASHARAICNLALRIGRELGLDEPSLKRLELGAVLHDTGTVGIPGNVLSGSGRLTSRAS
ncbi:MAG TPA: diguanylate cyclase [Gaiellaceae bacterium]|nr:diguanylate cyclase [Gaiellaceae bacterium]